MEDDSSNVENKNKISINSEEIKELQRGNLVINLLTRTRLISVA